MDSHFLLTKIASLLLYQSVLKNSVGEAFVDLLETVAEGRREIGCTTAYSHWFRSLATRKQSWQDFLITQILLDENPFSQQAQQSPREALPEALVAAASHDLQILQLIYNCSPQLIAKWGQSSIVWELPTVAKTFLHGQNTWQESIDALSNYYRKHGTGKLANYGAFTWKQRELVGITHPDPVQLDEIVGYESQKAALLQNTEFLLQGYRALHVLLYGSRGSGKSSLVKGLLTRYRTAGLRLVEVGKSQLHDLPTILNQLRSAPGKFIIFVDDLSFEEDDEAFKSLKVVLEGSLTARSQNVVVYATSNRRHLIREYFADRPRPSDADEIHNWDTLQEKLSFSDRFGLTLTFEPPSQDTYLEIVHHLAEAAGINLEASELEFRAKQWATRGNGRSGRTARQFIDFLQGELGLST